jgi:WD40 repeat protein
MVDIFRNRKPALILWFIIFLWLAWLKPSQAQEAPPPPSTLYDRPTLVIDPGMHTALLRRADVDSAGLYVVTGSEDKTVRVWSVTDGRLLRTIRIPSGPGNVGMIYALAISPDGKLIAAGGWTRWTSSSPQEQIYIFDRTTGKLLQRIEGRLPNIVTHLTFSPDGRHLVASMASTGLRVYKREDGFAEIARDENYGDNSYWADFAADGRLVTSCYDGKIRLYDSNFKLIKVIKAPSGQHPYGLAFSPDGRKLAVGYDYTTKVDLLDGKSLEPLPGPDTSGLENGDLYNVTWSQDGATLFAGGTYFSGNGVPVAAWSDAGLGQRNKLPAGNNTIMTLLPLMNGNLLVVSQDPYLTLLDANGKALWAQEPPQADFRIWKQRDLAVSEDGSVVDFTYDLTGKMSARFDLRNRRLGLNPQDDGRTAGPKQDGLKVTNWRNHLRPMLNGVRLPLNQYETSRSLAVHPDGKHFILGADFSLRAFDAGGGSLWKIPVPGVAWTVNISGDGRLVVVGYGDGTLRWHDMRDGRELLAFFPMKDQSNWVAWSPEGFYAATPGAHGVLRWHPNHG